MKKKTTKKVVLKDKDVAAKKAKKVKGGAVDMRPGARVQWDMKPASPTLFKS